MVNIYDIAKESKVSSATVSRVFNNPKIVAKETAEKVIKIAEKLDYTPSLIAASLTTKISGYVGFIIPRIDLPMYARIIEGVDDYLYTVGYIPIISNIGNKFEKLKFYFDIFRKRKLDGIIYSGLGFPEKEEEIIKKFLNQNNVPIVFLDRILPSMNLSYVTNDNFLGGHKAAEYLIELGHKKIVVVYSCIGASSIKLRLEGFKSAFKDKKISVDDSLFYKTDYFSVNSGYEAAEKIFNENKKFSSIFCITDELAAGVLKYAHENNISIPDDFSVMGYDDEPFASITNPALSTIHQVKYKMGYEAAKLVIKEIKKRKTSPNIKPIVEKIVFEPYLVKRESVKKI